jgi:hypothetical protein
MNFYFLIQNLHSAGSPSEPTPPPPETSEDVIKSGDGK